MPSFEPKRICCVLEGGHAWDVPLDAAISLALRYGAVLVFLHLDQAAHLLSGEDLAAGGLSRGEMAARVVATSERLFAETRSVADRAGVEVLGRSLRQCQSDQDALGFLREEAIDLLVLDGGASNEPLGAVFRTHAERLAHRAPCPALLVRRTEGATPGA